MLYILILKASLSQITPQTHPNNVSFQFYQAVNVNSDEEWFDRVNTPAAGNYFG